MLAQCPTCSAWHSVKVCDPRKPPQCSTCAGGVLATSEPLPGPHVYLVQVVTRGQTRHEIAEAMRHLADEFEAGRVSL